jgi:mono-ADP-ribosyltransferase sirtuin 6
MASTAHDDPEMMEEHYDPPNVLSDKVDRLAAMVRNSKHFVVFTGAGISTSAGIPDFRGPTGKWTRQAQGLPPVKGVSLVSAYPTSTHMVLVELYNRGVLKYLISQNCDGLHRRSGLPAAAISELHGNCWVEICEDCGQQHFRDFRCDRIIYPGGPKCPADHFTGRFCSCGGALLNSTIDFGQNLPIKPLERAQQHSRLADLHLALGSSLKVAPACDQPRSTARKGGNLVICNLQKTPLTNMATMQIFAKTDTVMEMLMERLSMPIPQFRLLRRIVFGSSDKPGHVYARAVDVHDPTLEVAHVCAVDWNGDGVPQKMLADPMAAVARNQGSHRHEGGTNLKSVVAKVHFVGHYQEPALDLKLDLSTTDPVDVLLSFNPYDGSWSVLSQVSVSGGQVQPPSDAVEARIPDYGGSHRQYCIDMVIKHKKCDKETANDIIHQRMSKKRQEARDEAGHGADQQRVAQRITNR